ncbi:MAG: NUDIX hydrolase [Gammaproteobacteria bacterium]|nr:NUDIX hydrolase [Gammaproteobacteria bacterium]
MNYCTRCGANTVYMTPPADNRRRHVCRLCGFIHYENPKIVCGCLVRSGERVLLCQRAIDPRKHMWTFPAGFLERGETTREGAIRETKEEACAEVTVAQLYIQFDLSYISQIYQFYLTDLAGSFGRGEETLDARLFSESDIPWNELAFPVVRETLQYYFQDRQRDHFEFRHVEIPDRSVWIGRTTASTT